METERVKDLIACLSKDQPKIPNHPSDLNNPWPEIHFIEGKKKSTKWKILPPNAKLGKGKTKSQVKK